MNSHKVDDLVDDFKSNKSPIKIPNKSMLRSYHLFKDQKWIGKN